MKILQINTIVNSGSTGRIAENIGRLAIDKGHESLIAYGRGESRSHSALIKIGNTADTYNHGVISFLFDRHGLGSKKATIGLTDQLKYIQPDIIGLHNLHGYFLNYPEMFSYLKSSGIPVIWTLHDCWSFTGHCTYFDSVPCQRWKTQCFNCPKTAEYPKSITDYSSKNFRLKKESFLGMNNLTIITPSHWLKNKVKQSFLGGYRIDVIHNGVDLDIFRPNFNNIKRNIVLGVASTWDERKGLSDFIQLRSILETSFEIVLIGLSNAQIRKLPKGIIGLQRTESQEELSVWYNRAVCFINPTYQDNFPTTNIESLACGTPVVTYNTGGSPEAVDDKTGSIVAKGDVYGLARAIQKLEAMDRCQLTIDCRRRAEVLFDQKHRYNDYISLYEKLVK